MPARELMRAIASCAPGKRVMVMVPSGIAYELPIPPAPPPPPPPPDPIATLAAELLERDVEWRTAVAEVSARADETLAAVKGAVSTIAEGQEKIAAAIDENTRTLHLPVKPVYFPDGKLRLAQRAEKG